MNKIILTVAFAALLTGAAATEAADGKMPPMRPDRPTHEMMEAKLADRLNLSKEQYLAMQDRRKADQVKIRDLMDQMKEIRIQMNEIRKSNMEAFESILTPEQKAEFEKIKAEGKARHMERKRMRHGMKPDPMSENRDMPPAIEKKPEAVDVSTPAEDPVKDDDTVPTVGASSAPQDISTKPTSQNGYEDNEEEILKENAHVLDLILPVVVLIISCIIAMVYTGGFFSGTSFVDAFANSSASVGLVLGGAVTLVFTFIYFMMRDVLSFKEFTDCIPEGFKAMVAPILILSMAWTLSGMTNLLGAKIFVAELVAGSALSMQGFLPMIIFLVAAFLAFATGTSWGTFSILIPIVIGVFPEGQMMVISIASCLAGAVCGDHCSPISDTTIMASAGAHCEHVNHVATQLPYVLLVAAVCMVGYFLIGVFRAVGLASIAWLALPICIIILLAILLIIRAKGTKEAA